MQYNGPQDLPKIKTLVELKHVLEEIGLDPRWNEHGIACRTRFSRGGAAYAINRQFTAPNPDRLREASMLTGVTVPAGTVAMPAAAGAEGNSDVNADIRVSADGHVTCTLTVTAAACDLSPAFVGRILDRSTGLLLKAAGLVGQPESASERSAD